MIDLRLLTKENLRRVFHIGCTCGKKLSPTARNALTIKAINFLSTAIHELNISDFVLVKMCTLPFSKGTLMHQGVFVAIVQKESNAFAILSSYWM